MSAGTGWHQRRARDLVARRLTSVREGVIRVQDADGVREFGSAAGDFPVRACLTVHDPRFYTRVLLRGSVGAGESYGDGDWEVDDLTALIRIVARNRDVNTGLERALARASWPFRRLRHRLRRNDRRGSRRNIADHYDLGNAFFQQFLDPTMMYSCAWFERDDLTLEQASRAKLELICRKLELRPGQRVVEIGSGWGGFAIHAARHHGCHVVTTTLSRQQYDWTRRNVRDAGLGDRVTVLLEDYRTLPETTGGGFDRLVSIEMIEAVGERFLDTYLQTVDRLLGPGGRGLIQAIVIDDDIYDEYRVSVDFIQRFIFPGGFLPSVGDLRRRMARETALQVEHIQDLTLHYAETLRRWRDNFRANLDQIRGLGFSERFIRLWQYYFAYCEGGFMERTCGDVQLVFNKRGGAAP